MIKKVVGIDLGDQWIKIIELKQRGRLWDIKVAGKVETPKQTIIDGEIINQQQLYAVLKAQLAQLGIKTKKVCIRMSSKQVLTKYLPMQVATVKEANKLIKTKKKEYFAVEGDYVIDAVVTGEKRGQELGALMVAVPNRVIQPMMGLVDQLGLHALTISIPSYGYCKQFEEETALVIDVGTSITSISCIELGACKLVNHTGFGMKRIEQAIGEEFGKGENEDTIRFYEKHLIVHPDANPEDKDFLSHYVSAVLATTMEEDLVPDLQKTVSFYEDLDKANHIDKVYLTGDCGRIKGLPKYLEGQLGISTQYLVPSVMFDERGLRRVKQDLTAFSNILCLTAASM